MDRAMDKSNENNIFKIIKKYKVLKLFSKCELSSASHRLWQPSLWSSRSALMTAGCRYISNQKIVYWPNLKIIFGQWIESLKTSRLRRPDANRPESVLVLQIGWKILWQQKTFGELPAYWHHQKIDPIHCSVAQNCSKNWKLQNLHPRIWVIGSCRLVCADVNQTVTSHRLVQDRILTAIFPIFKYSEYYNCPIDVDCIS